MQLFGGKPNIEKLFIKKNIKGLLKAIDYKEDQAIQKAAIDALGDLKSREAVDTLISILNDQVNILDRNAIVALGKIGDIKSVPYLISKLNSLSENEAIKALVNFGKSAVDILIAELENIDSKVSRKVVKTLLLINDERVIEPIISFLSQDLSRWNKGDWQRWIKDTIAELRLKYGGVFSIEHASYLYLMNNTGGSYAEYEPKIIPFLEDLLELKSIRKSGEIGENIVKTFAKLNKVERIVSLIHSNYWNIRKAAAKELLKQKYKLTKHRDKAAFYLIQGEFDNLNALSKNILKEVILELLKTNTDDIEYYIKREIAFLLLDDSNGFDQTHKSWADKVINDSTEEFPKYLERLVSSPREYKPNNKIEQYLFGDYTELISRITSYGGGRKYDDKVKPCIKAIKTLCHINSPIVNNLLCHIKEIKDTAVYTGQRYEVEYSDEHPDGMTSGRVDISFEKVRKIAQEELDKRGQPEYDKNLYKQKEIWELN